MGNSPFKGRKKQRHAVMLGLDGSGKTSILYKLKLHSNVETNPTLGFNVETLDYGSSRFSIWDVGGGAQIRPLWRHYFEGATDIIFVVDSCDHDRLHEAKQVLHMLMDDGELAALPLLIFANKQDITRNALRTEELVRSLRLNQLRDVNWYIQPSSAHELHSLRAGLDWLNLQDVRKIRPKTTHAPPEYGEIKIAPNLQDLDSEL